MSSVFRLSLSERTAIRISLAYTALCVGSAALGFVDATRPLVQYLFYLAFGLLFAVAFPIAGATPRRFSLVEMWQNTPPWCRDFVLLALAWFVGALFGNAELFQHPFDRRRTPIGEATPVKLMLPFAMFTCLNALNLASFLAARALGLEEEAPPETPAKEAGEVMPGVPKAVRVTIVLAVTLLFASEIANVFLRSYASAFLPTRPPGYALDCKNPKCSSETSWGCHPKTYTLCETLAGPDGTARYYRGLRITTYHFKDGQAGWPSELYLSSILIFATMLAGVALIALADRHGVKLGAIRLRLSSMPRSQIPAVCGLILLLSGGLSFAKMYLQEAVPGLLSAARQTLQSRESR